MKKLLFILFLSLVLGPISFAYADTTAPLYQVNIVIFTINNKKAANALQGYGRTLLPNLKETTYLIPSDAIPTDHTYNLLDDSKFGLTDEANALTKSGDYKIILQESWVEPMNGTPEWVQIQGGNAYDEDGNVIDPTTAPPAYFEIDGKIRFSRDYYFNVSPRLYLTLPTSNFENMNADGAPLTTFVLSEDRRTKLNQLNYFDHPLFGMLLSIEPVQTSS